MTAQFTTLTFERRISAPVATLWPVWTTPPARAIWATPSPDVTVSILHGDARPGGHERSLCRMAGQPDLVVDTGWLHMLAGQRSVNSEIVTLQGTALSAALVTAELTDQGDATALRVTVQLAALAANMAAGYRAGFGAGLDHLADVAARTMLIRRVIAAPPADVWGAWWNADTLPRWWGPDQFSCRTARIDLRAGGDWVFDMIGPDGTVYPNHHRYHMVQPGDWLGYALHWGENGPKHADAWASFTPVAQGTEVTLGMVFASAQEYAAARDFGAAALGLQTLGKLARHVGAA